MKLRNIFMMLAVIATAMLTGCKDKDPFETQKASDDPRILTPYNESGTGTFTYELANPDAHLVDSCLVTPSAYTVVKWYLDKQLVHTGLKIDQNFLAGHYDLLITATTTEGKETSRYGTVTVKPYEEDPYAEDPKAGRHFAPGNEVQLDGVNLNKAVKVLVTTEIAPTDLSAAMDPWWADPEGKIFKFGTPELPDGTYFVRLIDAAGKIYGADHLIIHNGPVALDGYFKEFTMGKSCTVTGLNLQDVNLVTINGIEIVPTAVTATSVSFEAPQLEEEGLVLMTMSAGGKAVQFLTETGDYAEAYMVNVLAKKLIVVAEGPIYVGCQGDPDWTAKVIDGGFDWSKVNPGTVLYIAAHRDGATTDYNNFKIMTNDWGWSAPSDGNFEFGDGINEKLFTTEVTSEMITAVTDKGGLCAAGHGTVIDRIYMEAPDETTIWEGPVTIDWNADLVKVTAEEMAGVRVGSTISVYWTDDPGPGYYAFRITTPWWGDDYSTTDNFVPRQDSNEIPNPYTFEWTQACVNLINERGAMSVLGAGFIIDKITYK